MASVESPDDKALANSMGWRTFRITEDEPIPLQDEIICPASKEGGRRVQCIKCRLCSGAASGAKNILEKIH
jgi:hypothetical protein